MFKGGLMLKIYTDLWYIRLLHRGVVHEGAGGSVRPKFCIGIGNQNQGPMSVSISVSEPIFFPKLNPFLQIFLIFPFFFGEYEFLQASK